MPKFNLFEILKPRILLPLIFIFTAAALLFAGIVLQAPVPVYPLNGDSLTINPGHKLTIKWNEVRGADGYVLVVEYKEAPGGEWNEFFKKKVGRSSGLGFVFPSVIYGRWRIWAVSKDGTPGDKCPWQEFKFKQ